MTGLPPADRSRAVLIGCGTYRHLPDLPAVANNRTDLAATLCDPALWGLAPGNCAVVPEGAGSTTSVTDVIDAVRRAAREVGTDGLLLIYYAGHGLIDSAGGRLHLAVTGSEHGEEDATAVAYESVRRRVWQSKAAYKLVILDCCYAGRALLGEMSGAGLAEDVEIDQSVIIAATSRNLVALAPPGARHTAFTGELLTILNRGLADGPPVLDTRTIWREIVRAQTAQGRPRPEFRSRNAADDIPLVRNAWRPPPPVAPDDAAPERAVRDAVEDPGPVAARSPRQRRWYSLLGALAGVAVLLGSVFVPKWWPAAGSGDLSAQPNASTIAAPGSGNASQTTPKASATSQPPESEPTFLDGRPNDGTDVTVPAGGSCADQEISVVPSAASSTVKRGDTLELTVTVKNVGARTCSRDVGAGPQELYLDQGARKYWSSDTCSTDKSKDVRQFNPGSQRVYKVTWNGRQSSSCSGNQAAGPNPPPGKLGLRARLGSLISDPVTLTIIA